MKKIKKLRKVVEEEYKKWRHNGCSLQHQLGFKGVANYSFLLNLSDEEVFKEISTDLGHPNEDGFARYLLKKAGYKIEKNKVIE
ncbi:hypothetical protein [Leptotrichia trevisanii]|uniref:hypothetical protein n=1 Tax=Leptotrichia trevisanii TaxID=109328 RepID=UPI0026EF6701|nr:hypothetical protein [Leptotrichia trevisanii]